MIMIISVHFSNHLMGGIYWAAGLFLASAEIKLRIAGDRRITGLSKLILLETNNGIKILEELLMIFFIQFSKLLTAATSLEAGLLQISVAIKVKTLGEAGIFGLSKPI